MRIFVLTSLLIMLFGLGCTKKSGQTIQKKGGDAADTSKKTDDNDDDDDTEESDTNRYKDGSRGDPNKSDKESQSKQAQAELVKLIGNWDGKSDLVPVGSNWQFFTRGFTQGPTPKPTGTAATSGTFQALVNEFRGQGCLRCHKAGSGNAGGSARPFDDHQRMVQNGTPASYVAGAAASVAAGRMPPPRKPQGNPAAAKRIRDAYNAWSNANPRFPAR